MVQAEVGRLVGRGGVDVGEREEGRQEELHPL